MELKKKKKPLHEGKYNITNVPRSGNYWEWSDQIRDQISRSVVSNSLRPHEPSTPGLPVHHQLPEFTQTHIHWVGDAIQPSPPLSSPSPPVPNPSQRQSLFQWVSSSHQVTVYIVWVEASSHLEYVERTLVFGPLCSLQRRGKYHL